MAKLQRHTIGLFFLGGSTIDERGRVGDTIRKDSDIDPWLRQMSEMDIIADTKGILISPGLQPIGLPEWAATAKAIGDHAADFDGFVVIHQLETMPTAAVALSLMLPKLEKPVVVCGSPLLTAAERQAGLQKTKTPETGEYGAKATFINAVQVAISDVAEVVMVYGSRIFRGATVAGPMTSISGQTIGKIDFGIRFFGEQTRRAKRGVHVRPAFDRQVAVVEYLPGMDTAMVVDQATHAHALFVSSLDHGAAMGSVVAHILPDLPSTLPVIVFDPVVNERSWPAAVIRMTGQSRTSALMKVMWALGQTTDRRRLRKLLMS